MQTDSTLPSRLEASSLLVSVASILVLNIPMGIMKIQLFNGCKLDHYDTSKTLDIAKHSEIPVKQ